MAAATAFTLVGLIFAVVAVDAVRSAPGSLFLAADFGLTELATREAAGFARLLGPWSRFGWNHPGPTYFYALAPTYVASGGRATGLYAAAAVINAVAALAVVATTARRAGGRGALAAAVVIAGFAAAVGPGALRDVWNPSVVVLPMLALLVLCAAGAAGSGWSLGAAAVGASFLAQTHVGTAPFALAALAAATVGWLRAARAAAPPGPARPPVSPAPSPALGRVGAALVVGVVTLLWTPPLVEQLVAPSGNLTELGRFVLAGVEPHGWVDSARAVAVAVTAVPFGPPAQDLPAGLDMGRIIVVATWAAAAVLCVVARPRERFVVALGWAALAGAALSVVLATRIAGPLLGYLVYWMAAVPLAGAIGVALLAGRAGSGPATRAAVTLGTAALAAALTVIACLGVRETPPLSGLSDQRVARIVSAAGERGALGEQPVLVSLASTGHGEWIVMAGVVNELDRLGIDVHVPDPWLPRYSPRQRASGDEPVELVLGEAGQPLDPRVLGDGEPLVPTGDTVAFLKRR